ncbi:PEP-CTERM sorting domain-containing protein [Herbaspirillum sp. SJZ107]|uniref:PEP-CTERM sorting domain-containing protein n=1 Tax=Herbaspirillum sp. SJZ107 TaxID=2572881 RepID=UPI00116707F5|nr:PEP-CTERM sorting domain-containing protein [Herbaspirillum sp. SJZ107]TQK07368.1 putative secreted protein [Herbaspirillum sp. SJZ107]
MKKIIMETLVLAALAAGQAHAAPLSLEHASITATYNGSADLLGNDSGYLPGPGSNVSGLDPNDSYVEFLTGDALFGVDFTRSGLLSIYANMVPPPAGSYILTFDFGTSLAAPITSFTLVDASAVGGLPRLSVLSSHSIGLDLSGLEWNADFIPVSAQIGTADAAAEVPEPASAAVLLAGVAGLALSRRRKRAAQA